MSAIHAWALPEAGDLNPACKISLQAAVDGRSMKISFPRFSLSYQYNPLPRQHIRMSFIPLLDSGIAKVTT